MESLAPGPDAAKAARMTATSLILRTALATLALAMGGCTHTNRMFGPAVAADQTLDWRAIATDADRERLRGWRDTWLAAMTAARAADPAAVPADDKLFLPDFALDHALPPMGDYHCRVFRLGGRGTAMAAFSVGDPGLCRIDAAGAHLRFTRLDGRQRPDGLLFAGTTGQGIFLGTLLLSDEAAPIPYGVDDRRDIIGLVDRVGERRWRIAIPDQALGPRIQLIELTPASN